MTDKGHKALVLFGAGASIPFFCTPEEKQLLTTNTITDALFKEDHWNNVLVYNTDLRQHIPQIIKLLSLIRESLGKTANFEDIAEIVDMIGIFCEGNYSASLNDFIFLLCNKVYEVDYLSKFDNDLLSPSYQYLPYFYREVIADYIIQLYKTKPECYFRMVEQQAKLLQQLSNDFDSISLVTLNYDDCISDSILKSNINFANGFKSETVFDDTLFFDSKNSISYLHGHIRMVNTSRYFATFFRNMENAFFTRRSNYASPFATHPQKNVIIEDKNIFLTTGKSKSNSLGVIPYSSYYSKLAFDIFDANVFFILGYSFNDAHINQLICNYLSINPSRILVIIDYAEREKNKGLPDLNKYVNSLSLFLKWNGFYGVEYYKSIFDSNDEELSINERGHGWIMGRRAFLYLNGYEAFLKDSDNLLNIIYDNS